jgi:hypothetical protein
MFDRLYQKEIDMMHGLLNQKQTIQNTYHTMSHDENLKRYLKQAVNYAKSGGSREDMGFHDHYFIIKQNEDIMIVFNLLVASLLAVYIDKSGEDIAEPCVMFPDQGGETLLRLIGFIPLLKLVSEHVKFTEFIKKHTSLDEKDTMVEFQRERLFSKSQFMRRCKFPGDDKFTDYELRNEYIDSLKINFTKREGELLQQMRSIALLFEDKPTLSNDNALRIGIQFWDQSRDAKQSYDKKEKEKFSSFITAFANHIDDDAQTGPAEVL